MRMLLHKVCKALHISAYFEMDKGIKGYNRPLFRIPSDIKLESVTINPNEVYLSYDGLRDELTHVEKSIVDSPHVDMINRLKKGLDIQDCDYVRGEIEGYLDGRFEQLDSYDLVEFHIKKFMAKQNSEKPLVYSINDKYYVLDGKHRIATAVVFNEQSIECCVLPLSYLINYRYTRDLYKAMCKRGDRYSKNIKHIKSIIEDGKEI